MNEGKVSLPSYSDLADETKALKIENKILKDKIKASKGPIKVLVQWHDKFTWKQIKTDAKMRFYAWIASVVLSPIFLMASVGTHRWRHKEAFYKWFH